jgi:hypothetical protein
VEIVGKGWSWMRGCQVFVYFYFCKKKKKAQSHPSLPQISSKRGGFLVGECGSHLGSPPSSVLAVLARFD